MGYSFRPTLGWLDCRPKEYKSDVFPKPSSRCSKKCIYHIFCELELSHMTLGERLKEIKLITQKPYHFFSRTLNGKGVTLYLEGADGKSIYFTGRSILEAIKSAEEFIERGKRRGTLGEARK